MDRQMPGDGEGKGDSMTTPLVAWQCPACGLEIGARAVSVGHRFRVFRPYWVWRRSPSIEVLEYPRAAIDRDDDEMN